MVGGKSYELAQFSKARVHVDYHIEVEGHYYSVPHSLIKQIIEVRLTLNTLECFHEGVALPHTSEASSRKTHNPCRSICRLRMSLLRMGPGRFLNWALDIGPNTRGSFNVLQRQPIPARLSLMLLVF